MKLILKQKPGISNHQSYNAMKYKVAIFDFDGTLANSFPFFLSILDELADKYHRERVSPEQLRELRKMSTSELLKYFHFPMWRLPLIGRNVNHQMSQNINKISLFEGMDALIQDLASLGMILVVVSSNSYENVIRVLGENAALFSHFECGSALLGKKKRFQRVLKKFNVDPAEVISIGDEIRDMEASKKMDIAFGAVTWGFNDPEVFESRNPDHIFYSVSEIGSVLTGA
ncbi:phosphoglycolate phosphatase [Leptolinea sp. HRD-7]|nr:phosphoglycolate phosphatase [Leptolinea sp. HRD-7]